MLRELVRRVEKEALAIAEEKNAEITELRRVEDEKFAMEGALEMARVQIADLRARTQTQQQEMVYLSQKLEIANSALKVQSAEQLQVHVNSFHANGVERFVQANLRDICALVDGAQQANAVEREDLQRKIDRMDREMTKLDEENEQLYQKVRAYKLQVREPGQSGLQSSVVQSPASPRRSLRVET